MRRGLVHALAWSLATGAAVTLSWWGVHTVLSGTVYDPPRALPLPAGATDEPATAGGDPLSSSTRRPGSGTPSAPATPKATPSAGPTTAPATPSSTPSRTARPTTEAPTTAPADSGSDVKTYTVDGGRVTFDLGKTSAELVSAIPASGWQMQVWKQATWIRVTFTADGRELSVFCVWHDTAPRVEIEDRAV
ncbi:MULTISPECIES: hypothetical protein [unclassified Streptomyces]|uniref:hypothetical protein n=1 Tax=unclassified Streptomyces TaxID=2593676 RepID=UPI0006F426A7|nr:MULTISPECIES: hypothetical protein [unclassified Streptomyces]KQX53660.1 hypothetical protein ASD33_05935 [Streptomyces sp. Root1304]KRA90578.1 hypothetical protein ASE09_05940 [Streptomyces sp. Root66D1]